MKNIYLEKLAGWTARVQGSNAGKAMGDISNSTNAEVLARMGQSKPTGSFDAKGKTGLSKGFMGLGKKPVNVANVRATGDATVSGKDLGSRLKDFKTNKAATEASAGAKGILGKAVGMAKKNPVIAAGVAGLGVGAALASRKKDNAPQGYYQ